MGSTFAACCCCGGFSFGEELYRDWDNHPAVRQYSVIQRLGEGGFSEVQLARDRLTGKTVALKVVFLNKAGLTGEQRKILSGEARLVRMVAHPNIIRCMQVLETRRQQVLVLEHLSGGELLQQLQRVKRYTEATACQLFRQIADAVGYLHSLGILHRDIKPENCLLAKPAQHYASKGKPVKVKLIDLGMAGLYRPARPLYGCMGSPGFIAPEAILGEAHTSAMDVYSLGVMLFVMLVGRKPWDARCSATLEYGAAATADAPGLADPAFKALSLPAQQLLLWMLDEQPQRRPSTEQVLNHAWMRQGAAATSSSCHERLIQPTVQQRLRLLSNSRQVLGTARGLLLLHSNGSRSGAAAFHWAVREARLKLTQRAAALEAEGKLQQQLQAASAAAGAAAGAGCLPAPSSSSAAAAAEAGSVVGAAAATPAAAADACAGSGNLAAEAAAAADPAALPGRRARSATAGELARQSLQRHSLLYSSIHAAPAASQPPSAAAAAGGGGGAAGTGPGRSAGIVCLSSVQCYEALERGMSVPNPDVASSVAAAHRFNGAAAFDRAVSLSPGALALLDTDDRLCLLAGGPGTSADEDGGLAGIAISGRLHGWGGGGGGGGGSSGQRGAADIVASFRQRYGMGRIVRSIMRLGHSLGSSLGRSWRLPAAAAAGGGGLASVSGGACGMSGDAGGRQALSTSSGARCSSRGGNRRSSSNGGCCGGAGCSCAAGAAACGTHTPAVLLSAAASADLDQQQLLPAPELACGRSDSAGCHGVGVQQGPQTPLQQQRQLKQQQQQQRAQAAAAQAMRQAPSPSRLSVSNRDCSGMLAHQQQQEQDEQWQEQELLWLLQAEDDAASLQFATAAAAAADDEAAAGDEAAAASLTDAGGSLELAFLGTQLSMSPPQESPFSPAAAAAAGGVSGGSATQTAVPTRAQAGPLTGQQELQRPAGQRGGKRPLPAALLTAAALQQCRQQQQQQQQQQQHAVGRVLQPPAHALSVIDSDANSESASSAGGGSIRAAAAAPASAFQQQATDQAGGSAAGKQQQQQVRRLPSSSRAPAGFRKGMPGSRATVSSAAGGASSAAGDGASSRPRGFLQQSPSTVRAVATAAATRAEEEGLGLPNGLWLQQSRSLGTDSLLSDSALLLLGLASPDRASAPADKGQQQLAAAGSADSWADPLLQLQVTASGTVEQQQESTAAAAVGERGAGELGAANSLEQSQQQHDEGEAAADALAAAAGLPSGGGRQHGHQRDASMVDWLVVAAAAADGEGGHNEPPVPEWIAAAHQEQQQEEQLREVGIISWLPPAAEAAVAAADGCVGSDAVAAGSRNSTDGGLPWAGSTAAALVRWQQQQRCIQGQQQQQGHGCHKPSRHVAVPGRSLVHAAAVASPAAGRHSRSINGSGGGSSRRGVRQQQQARCGRDVLLGSKQGSNGSSCLPPGVSAGEDEQTPAAAAAAEFAAASAAEEEQEQQAEEQQQQLEDFYVGSLNTGSHMLASRQQQEEQAAAVVAAANSQLLAASSVNSDLNVDPDSVGLLLGGRLSSTAAAWCADDLEPELLAVQAAAAAIKAAAAAAPGRLDDRAVAAALAAEDGARCSDEPGDPVLLLLPLLGSGSGAEPAALFRQPWASLAFSAGGCQLGSLQVQTAAGSRAASSGGGSHPGSGGSARTLEHVQQLLLERRQRACIISGGGGGAAAADASSSRGDAVCEPPATAAAGGVAWLVTDLSGKYRLPDEDDEEEDEEQQQEQTVRGGFAAVAAMQQQAAEEEEQQEEEGPWRIGSGLGLQAPRQQRQQSARSKPSTKSCPFDDFDEPAAWYYAS